MARTLTRNDADAEDLVQDTLIRPTGRSDASTVNIPGLAAHDPPQHPHHPQPSPSTQLFRDGDEANDRLATTAGPNRADGAVEATFDAAVEQALAELDEPFRRVIQLDDIDGLTYAEAAARLQIPVGTVMSRLHRARSRMRRRLEASGLTPKNPR